MNKKILIIQTAFIGDAILISALAEQLHAADPDQEIHLLLRKGCARLYAEHPFISKVMEWDKSRKLLSWWQLLREIRRERYDILINAQRFALTGLLTVLSGAGQTVGFSKNPFSFLFSQRVKHEIGNDTHEVNRNLALIARFCDTSTVARPRLYPSPEDLNAVAAYTAAPSYVCIAPASLWFTKQLPVEKWVELINRIPPNDSVYILGAESDSVLFDKIQSQVAAPERLINLCGKLSLRASAALMAQSAMNYVNDSAPLHLASAMNAPVTAFFCSTVPAFGFAPLSEQSRIVEANPSPACRPCGLHGKKSCPQGHFRCAYDIDVKSL